MSEKQPYQQLNLPRHHLPELGKHYQPFFARQEAEIYKRRQRRNGSLVLEQQADGLSIASFMALRLKYGQTDDGNFTTKMLALAGLNTSFYMYGQGAETMSRKLVLPDMLDDKKETAVRTRQDLVESCADGLYQAASLGLRFVDKYVNRKETATDRLKLGRSVGNTALALAALNMVDSIYGQDGFEAQARVRDLSIKALEEARESAELLGAYPSMAQLADRKSQLMVYWQRKAPNEAMDLFNQAESDWSNAKSFF